MGKASQAKAEMQAQNRALRRQIANLERLTGGVFITREKAEEFMFAQEMLHLLVKRDGRLRITDAERKSLTEGDSITMKRDDGHMTLTYVRVEPPAAETEQPAEQAEEDDEDSDGS